MKYRLIVDIKVIDLERAVKFYTQALGLTCRIHKQDDGWAGIAVGDAEIHLYVDGGVTGDVEFYVDDLEEAVTRMTQNGVMFNSGIDKPSAIRVDGNNITEFPWGRIAFFRDSEGNELALVKDKE